jgi:hypothetical protein
LKIGFGIKFKTLRSNLESVPKQLEGVLWEIAQRIPVCIVSSKGLCRNHHNNDEIGQSMKVISNASE